MERVMFGGDDPYWKLRPRQNVPADLCECTDSPAIIVQDHLSSMPLACLRCNGEVPADRIGFSEELAEKLADWRSVYHALTMLWLDSGQYSEWARVQLERTAK